MEYYHTRHWKLNQCWFNVGHAVSTFNQHWVNVLCSWPMIVVYSMRSISFEVDTFKTLPVLTMHVTRFARSSVRRSVRPDLLPSKHGTLAQCGFNVGTLTQHWNHIGLTPRVCWVQIACLCVHLYYYHHNLFHVSMYTKYSHKASPWPNIGWDYFSMALICMTL